MEHLNYANVIPSLFECLPEAKTAYQDWQKPGETLPYIVFSLLDESFITPMIKSSGNEEMRRRTF